MLPAAACVTGLSATYPQAPWSGGFVSIWADQANNAVRIGYYGIPQSACVALANAQANAPGLIYSYAGLAGTGPHFTTYPPLGASSTWTTTQIDIYCADSTTNDEATFAYTMN
jgi:hypothetical protein